MLVTFSTKSYSNIMMFGDIAKQLLRMMGNSATVPGAIVAEDVPEALRKLKHALNIEDDQPKHIAAAADGEEESEHVVSLRHRALPLVELLENATRKGNDVMWK
jgi:hypothetical protein